MSTHTEHIEADSRDKAVSRSTSRPGPGRPSAPVPKSRHGKEGDRGGAPAGQAADVTEGSKQILDRLAHAWVGHTTAGVSPASILAAYADWSWHLSTSPGKQAQLLEKAWRKTMKFAGFLPHALAGSESGACIQPLAHDKRFSSEEWQEWPFNAVHQSFLLTQQWWHNATTNVDGVSEHHGDVVNFTTRQILDTLSPSNNPCVNPEVIKRSIKTGGRNFLQGFANWFDDSRRLAFGEPPAGAEEYQPGRTVAVTPGKVVYRNDLMELIQYSPATDRVRAEPVLIVPAWIMKYYILDLSPENSLVRWLVGQGHTVFIISWKNPGSEDRDTGMDDYRESGIMAALDAVNAIVPGQKVNAVGYCLGGTLLSIAAAAMSRDHDDRLASITLFASLTDFSVAGELELFIDESEVDFLEDLMWDTGYLDSIQMKGTFQFLRSNDLIWSHLVHDYLMGQRMPMFDLMAWSTDATRLPYRMHSEYLRRLYLRNELSEGRYKVGGNVISLGDVRLPLFVVGTRKDHIAPWQSVFEIHALAGGDVTFVLTSGGHNAGVVSEPGHRGRVYQIADKAADAPYVGPETWREEVAEREGSWWPEWHTWLCEHSAGESGPPTMGVPDQGYKPLADAPGRYVLQR
jgi:polyhydroxyalkanoate synthase